MSCTSGLDVIWQIQNDYIWIIVGPMATVLIVSFFPQQNRESLKSLAFVYHP